MRYRRCDTGDAIKRAAIRAKETGRDVSEEVLKFTHQNVSAIFPQAVSEGIFDHWTLWSNEDNAQPVMIAGGSGKSGKVANKEGWQRFLQKGGDDVVSKWLGMFDRTGVSDA